MVMIIENEYKKELKARVLSLASKMFFQYGIRKVKMNDIAAHLKISKRTLYEIYQNKEDLLYEVVMMNAKHKKEEIERFDKPGLNVINIVMHVLRLQTEEFNKVNPLFYEELGKYPKLQTYFAAREEEKYEKLVEFIERGVNEGCFLSNIDIKLYSRLTSASGEYIMTNFLYDEYNYKEILKTFIMFYIRSICTEKGIKLLDKKMANFFK